MKPVTLKNIPLPITPLGLGCMGMSEFYGATDDAVSLKVMARALELGINFFDTADMYGQGHNETLLGRFARDNRDALVIASKCGIRRTGNPADRSIDTSPAYIVQACEASLKRLGVETIDLYYLHRLDGVTPVEDSMGALAELGSAGKIRAAGLSEVSAETLERACSIFPVTALQSEYSLTSREPEAGVLATCQRLGTTFVAYSPLGRGLLTGTIRSQADLDPGDVRRSGFFPRFQGEALASNLALADKVAEIARQRSATPGQVALAWLLSHRGVVPIPGTRKISRLEENVGALELSLSAREIAALEAALPPGAVKGGRYAPPGMAALDR